MNLTVRVLLQRYLSILLISLSITFMSCFNEENDTGTCPGSCTVIKGRLTTLDSKLPLAGAPLTINWVNTQYVMGGTIRKKANTRTDENGFFEMSFLIRDEELTDGYFKLEFDVDKSKYLVYENNKHGYPFFDLKRDTTITLPDYLIPRKAFLEVRLANPADIQQNDYFASTFGIRMGVPTDFKWGGSVITWSIGLPANPVIEVAGGQPIVVETSKTKDNIKTTTYDTLNIAVGQKQVYTAQF